jgi:outer membrane protein OmpA-like peptidoglycan-associated protein
MCKSYAFQNILLSLILLIPFVSFAQNLGKSYNDGHGKQVYLPNGSTSFADEVITLTKGNPPAIVQSSNPIAALGMPDYDGVGKGFISLGCGGSLIVRFTDNALINIDGPDLYIFEVGKYIESTELSISKDAINWISIGTIDGAKAEVDIASFTNKEDVFSYVRLVDLKTECKGMWSGADIDAIAAIGTAKRVSITGTVLFNLNESVLKPDAKKLLDKLTEEINQTSIERILVEGYTDSLGTEVLNKKLSLTRAIAVKTYIQKKMTNKQITITALGLAESNPLFTDKTNQNKNRRVEVILIPEK